MEVEQVFITYQNTINNTNFILDSGSSQHIVYNKELFIKGSLEEKTTLLQWGNNNVLKSKAIGKIALITNNYKLILQNCLYVPKFSVNLISVNKLIQKDFAINFVNNKATITKNN